LRATQLAHATLGLGDADGEVPAPQQDLTAPTQRKGTKQAQLIAMLRANDGATIDEIVAALGWRAHTIRGAMSGALKKKLGLEVTSEKIEGRGRIYKLPAA
jgi:predicted ArsR family transcriptional regulator